MRVQGMKVGAAVGLAMAVFVGSPAWAEEVDQQAVWNPTEANKFDSAWVSPTQSVSQTFTAGVSGDLTKVEVDLNPDDPKAATNLTLGIYATTFDANQGVHIPTGNALASQQVTAATLASLPADQWGDRGTISATLTAPARVTQGTVYAIVASTTDGITYKWFSADRQPELSTYGPGSSWSKWGQRLVFKTFVGAGSSASSAAGAESGQITAGSSDSGDAPVLLTLQSARQSDAVSAQAEVKQGWVQLPGIELSERSAGTFLGWSTSEHFPVERARAQIAAGWGAIDEVIGDERLIFIPAGGFAHVTGPTHLHAIWG